MADDEYVGSEGIVKKAELVRVIGEALYSFGYSRSVEQLENESGIVIRSPPVASFMRQILDGQWDESVRTLPEIGIPDVDYKKFATVLINEQKFFELLHQEKKPDALSTLRTEIAPFCEDNGRIKNLSILLVSELNPLDETSHQKFEVESRKKLLEELQKLLHPAIIAETRLISLVEQALGLQLDHCKFHNSSEISLLADHLCGMENIPSQTLQVLDGHSKEVWFLQFSHNGEYLASSSADCSAIIWEVKTDGPVSMKHRLSLHERPVSCVSWSPDDKQILTCGVEESVRRWDVASGDCLCVYRKTGVGLISCLWALDRDNIFTGAADESIIRWDLRGVELETYNGRRTLRMPDMGISADGERVITVCDQKSMALLDWKSTDVNFLFEYEAITSFALSEDRKFLLVSLANAELHLFSIGGYFYSIKFVARYKGHKRSRFVVRSCLGGHKQAYIASGSEDSMVYIWKRSSAELIATLEGHSGVVNCVSWNPANPQMLASASDDRTIRIWGPSPAPTKKAPTMPSMKDPFSGAKPSQAALEQQYRDMMADSDTFGEDAIIDSD